LNLGSWNRGSWIIRPTIIIFTYVKRQLQTLTARGETTNDLILFLFRGYLMVKCTPFVDFITRKEEGYTADGVAYTPESLMSMAEKYYEILKIKGLDDHHPT
jgi:hypothetical protein